MEEHLRSNLAACLAAFMSARRLSTARVANLAAGDWRFFDRVAGGTNFTVRKYDEVVAWFSAHWPPEVGWPVGVPRPALTPAEPASEVAA